jgi:hypothetical protein
MRPSSPVPMRRLPMLPNREGGGGGGKAGKPYSTGGGGRQEFSRLRRPAWRATSICVSKCAMSDDDSPAGLGILAWELIFDDRYARIEHMCADGLPSFSKPPLSEANRGLKVPSAHFLVHGSLVVRHNTAAACIDTSKCNSTSFHLHYAAAAAISARVTLLAFNAGSTRPDWPKTSA